MSQRLASLACGSALVGAWTEISTWLSLGLVERGPSPRLDFTSCFETTAPLEFVLPSSLYYTPSQFFSKT